tara:strand:+ start:1510 stop:1674 length:165 start_codon:yes stop_codon:yes gene_type:complete
MTFLENAKLVAWLFICLGLPEIIGRTYIAPNYKPKYDSDDEDDNPKSIWQWEND